MWSGGLREPGDTQINKLVDEIYRVDNIVACQRSLLEEERGNCQE